MKPTIWMSFAVAAGIAFSASASAATESAPDAAAHNAAVSAVRARLATARAAAAPSGMNTKAMGQYVYPGAPMANPYRAYPPSCAAYPLPDKASGPANTIYTVRMPLFTRDPAGNPLPPETVTVTVWRMACSSTGSQTPYNTDGGYNAMTLMRIDRDPANDHHTDFYPTFPVLQVKQLGVGYDDTASLVRAANEPNTVLSDGMFDAPLIDSATYVLENFNYGAAFNHQYSLAFNFRIDPSANNAPKVEFQIPAYSPSPSTYPDAYNPLPLDGYMSGTWYDPSHSGEGIQIEVAEQLTGSGHVVRPLVFSWYTYDASGTPFWISGNGIIDPNNPTIVTAGANYTTGGGFAGNFNPSAATLHPWGTITFQFVNCNTIQFNYQSASGLPAGVPSGSGSLTWSRLTNVNGMSCE
ncbi:MAG: hypothetical protein ABI082_05405 [Dokdonella sp.]